MNNKIVWKPQPRQSIFMSRPEYEALYGGAAGGGKSDALIIEALRQVNISHYKALILRRTYGQLSELIEKSLNYYKAIYPTAKYNHSQHKWTFSNGSQIIFGSLNDSMAKFNYQGHAYDFIAFDELTHFTFDDYMFLMSRNRPNGPRTRVYIRSTANPGGIGHGWVKDRFISPAPPMTPIKEEISYVDPDGKVISSTQTRIFVPSTVFDNQILMANDPNYISRLASLPEAEKNALLYGDWDSFSGQVFVEFVNDSKNYDTRQHTHVINAFKIPKDWSIWCSLDWGYSKPFSVGWYAVDHDRRIYRIREYYGCRNNQPNTGLMLEPTTVANTIKEIESNDVNLKDRKIFRIGDPAIWQSDGTESTGRLFERSGLYFERGDHNRYSGKMQIHHRLKFDENGIPLFYVFNSCTQFIRTFTGLVYSQSNVEDVDSGCEDHIYDEFRYICMRNPISVPEIPNKRCNVYNPLESDDFYNNPKYKYYRR